MIWSPLSPYNIVFVKVASKLPSGSDYSLFKEGIFPDWEDKR